MKKGRWKHGKERMNRDLVKKGRTNKKNYRKALLKVVSPMQPEALGFADI